MDVDIAGPATKKVLLEKRESTFGSAEGRSRSYQEEAAVAPELRSKLESIGMRTRFNVGRGYGSPPPSQSQGQFADVSLDGGSNSNHVFASNNQILQSVRNTRNAWNRTKSAPLYSNELMPFCGLRADIISQDENSDPNLAQATLPGGGMAYELANEVNEGIGLGDLKRNRDDVLGDWVNDDDAEEEAGSMDLDAALAEKPIAALPRRSSPTSSSFGLPRSTAAHTLPISAGLSSYLASAQDNIDFSAFANKSDF